MKKIQVKYLLYIILTINIGFTQETTSIFSVLYNPNDTNYWWLENNNNGKYIFDKEIQYEFELINHKTKYKFNISNAYKENRQFDFGESFIKHSFSDKTYIRIGKYYRDFSKYLNDDLSSGSMLVSKNAQPIPKIGFVHSYNLKRNKNIAFDFGVSHGMFKKNKYYTKTPLLHEKFLYLNIKRKNQYFSFGFVHEAMWSGATKRDGKFPSKFKDFLKVFISADGPYIQGPHANALGNHLGIWDFYYKKTIDTKVLNLYYQHFFEDTSGLRFANKFDGLWGIELENYFPNTTVLFEYLNTTNANNNPPYQDDYYYSNYQYLGGWVYKNNIIGNSFVNKSGLLRDFQKIQLMHLGINREILSNTVELKVSRKINFNDSFLYLLSFDRNINDFISLKGYVVNNKNKNGFGLSLSYIF